MGVDKLLLVDVRAVDETFGGDGDLGLFKLGLDELLHGLEVRVRLDKDERHVLDRVHLALSAADGLELREAGRRVGVLDRVKQRRLGALNVNLRVRSPALDGLGIKAGVRQSLAESVLLELGAHPVETLSEALKRAGARMDAVITRVGLRRKTEILVLLEDRVAERAVGGRRWVRSAEHLAAEVLPAQILLVPFDGEVVDGGSLGDVLLTHAHVEAVNHVRVLKFEAKERVSQARTLPPEHARTPRSLTLVGRESLQPMVCLCERLVLKVSVGRMSRQQCATWGATWRGRGHTLRSLPWRLASPSLRRSHNFIFSAKQTRVGLLAARLGTRPRWLPLPSQTLYLWRCFRGYGACRYASGRIVRVATLSSK